HSFDRSKGAGAVNTPAVHFHTIPAHIHTPYLRAVLFKAVLQHAVEFRVLCLPEILHFIEEQGRLQSADNPKLHSQGHGACNLGVMTKASENMEALRLA